MDRLSARLPACNDPTRIFEGEVVEAGIALHGLSSLMMTCESTVTCSQIAALIESIAVRLDMAFDQFQDEQAKMTPRPPAFTIK